jgi:NAD-dependent SIR2 family protein deacetylase
VVNGVITQNVDGLHQAAGSVTVVELHGSLALVRCLRCGRTESRESLQGRIKLLNPEFMAAEVRVLPDGDADLDNSLIGGFVVPECLHCGGVLKTDVVFFGENVPAARAARSVALLDGADALLVLGSSLAVRSGYRFVVNAKEAGKLVAIVNHGPTRGDADADVRVEGRLGQVLPALARLLAAPPP